MRWAPPPPVRSLSSKDPAKPTGRLERFLIRDLSGVVLGGVNAYTWFKAREYAESWFGLKRDDCTVRPEAEGQER